MSTRVWLILIAPPAVIVLIAMALNYWLDVFTLSGSGLKDISPETLVATSAPMVALGYFLTSKPVLSYRPWGDLVRAVTESAIAPLFHAKTLLPILLVSISAGVSEELLFRAIMQPKFGLLGAAVIFALAHCANAFMFFVVLFIGLYLGFLLREYQNLWIAIIAHSVLDFVVFARFRRDLIRPM